MTTEKMVATGGGPMIGVARRQKPRKPTARLVAQLERELAKMTDKGCRVAVQLNAVGRALSQKNDELIQVLNDRDETRNERDSANRESADARRQAVLYRIECERTEHGLRGDLSRLLDAQYELQRRYADLQGLNQRNFDRAARSADVAAVLASLLAATNSPIDLVDKITDTVARMGVSSDIIGEVRTALKRGYDAQVNEAIYFVGGKIDPPSTANIEKGQLNDLLNDLRTKYSNLSEFSSPLE